MPGYMAEPGGCHGRAGVSNADDLEKQLAAGMRKVLQWSARPPTVLVPFGTARIGDCMVAPFFNANTPADIDFVRSVVAGAAP